MRILIVTLDKKCPAAYACRADGWMPDIRVIDREDTTAYSRALGEYWLAGERFINIEHDMAPWPGAIQALWSCTQELCVYGYYRATMGSLGIVRFSEEVIARFPDLPTLHHWDRCAWNMLESKVYGGLKNVKRHKHLPDVAHLSGWFT